MKRRARDLWCVVAVVGVLVALWLAGELGLRVNDTASMPLGFYRTTGASVGRGDSVLLCPPSSMVFQTALMRGYLEAGSCSGVSYLMKRVWAVPGDRIAVRDGGVFVNGERVPNSAPRALDAAGRALPHYRVDDYRLPSQQYLLLSETNARSFDGRYFGPVERKQIIAVIRPLLVWENNT